MKKLIIAVVLFSLLIPMACVGDFAAFAETDASSSETATGLPTAEDLMGYENLNLTYTFRYYSSDNGKLYQDDFMPYVAYLDKQGNVKDYFFDSYLFLPCMDFGPSGARMHIDLSNPTKAIDWTTYVNDTFASGANVEALNDAFGYTKEEMGDGDTDKKAGVFFTILYPAASAANFGSLGGQNLNFSKTEDRKTAIKWIIDEQISLFEEGNYENLELVGFYWLEEFVIAEGDVELFQYASDYLHSLGLKFIWIPWYLAEGYNRGEELGFDAVCMQPNLFWLGYTDPNRVNESVEISKKYNMGMEMEVDFRVGDAYYFNRYLYYLEGGMNSGMMNAVKMYYQDSGPGVYYSACYSNETLFRQVYDLTYKYAKGTLTQEDIDSCRPEGMDDNFVDKIDFDAIYRSADWVSLGKTYTGCESYVDGNGAAYQNVSGKELTDGIIANEDLSTDWFAFHENVLDNQGRMSITIDLGEVRDDLTNFAAHFDNKQLYAIGSPMDVKIYISNNGRNFSLLTSPELVMDSTISAFHYQCEPVTARYVKLSIGYTDKIYVFCSEFLVGIDHVHKPDSAWTSDSKEHWHGCSCGEKFDLAAHTEGQWETVINADIDVEGKKELRCTVCNGVIETEIIPALKPKYPLGDVNRSGTIDMMDYILLKRNYFGTFTFDEEQSTLGDVNRSDAIDMMDYILLKRAYFGTFTLQ